MAAVRKNDLLSPSSSSAVLASSAALAGCPLVNARYAWKVRSIAWSRAGSSAFMIASAVRA